jgi:phospholipid/cholesterol/gamma-HCH transport system ATP-binding protein
MTVREEIGGRVVAACRGLSCGYGEPPVLTGVDLAIRAGEVVTILGTSGSGKSTLLRTMIGLQAPLRGEVRLFGERLHDSRGRPRPELLRRVGMLFQQGALFGSMSVLENVMLPLVEQTPLPLELVEAVARAKLRQVRLEDTWARLPSQLSGGQQKRVALARATVFDPPLLFCDEPGAGLDPVVASELDDLLLELRANLGITVVVVTHEVESIRRIADRAVMLRDGGIGDAGSVDWLEREGDEATRMFFDQVPRRRPERPSALDYLRKGACVGEAK